MSLAYSRTSSFPAGASPPFAAPAALAASPDAGCTVSAPRIEPSSATATISAPPPPMSGESSRGNRIANFPLLLLETAVVWWDGGAMENAVGEISFEEVGYKYDPGQKVDFFYFGIF
jgi:hypothetical protein